MKIPDITMVKIDGRIMGKVRCFLHERLLISGQHRHLQIQIQLLICPSHAFQ